MAKKLSPKEYIERHLQEVYTVLSPFKKDQELQYREIRKNMFLDKKSLLNRKREKSDEPSLSVIAHETQLTRILNALCEAAILKKTAKGNGVYYIINASKTQIEELRIRGRASKDPNFFKEFTANKEYLEKQLEGYKNRIYELNLEIGRHIKENIELKEQITKMGS